VDFHVWDQIYRGKGNKYSGTRTFTIFAGESLQVRIYIIGYMSSGKSWLGKELAERTGYQFTDLDTVFEERYRLSILDFFSKYGEALFRDLESRLLHETASLSQAIISTGGGAPCWPGNMQFILKAGISVYLKMPLPELLQRIRRIKKKRPLLINIPHDRLEDFIKTQLAEREAFYNQANFTFSGPDYPVEEILRTVFSSRATFST
jgi:shikimate kinase